MKHTSDLAPPGLPAGLRSLLVDLRRRLWRTKTMEVVFAAAFGLLASFLLVFALDRVMETPAWMRLVLLLAGLVGGVVFLPLQVSRWVVGHASLLQVARRVAREDVRHGDQLLSIYELSEDEGEFRRSPELAHAAVVQGEEQLSGKDFSHTLPLSRHRAWGTFAGGAAAATAVAFAVFPGAGTNALARWALPFADVERYTFTRLEDFSEHQVVARFEEFTLPFALAEDTRRRPTSARLELAGGDTLEVDVVEDAFVFDVEPLGNETSARLVVGDYIARLAIEPLERPEVQAAAATLRLPAYLELPDPIQKDVRGGSVGLVAGASIDVTAELTRELSEAAWVTPSGVVPTTVDGATVTTDSVPIGESIDTHLEWTDVHGLEGTVPFQLALRVRADGKPTVLIEDLQQDMILLHDQAAVFRVRANDDFGVRRAGLVWSGTGELEGNYQHAEGEKLLGLGDPDARDLELRATLHPLLLGIDPQLVEVRAWALDALPGRERIYSAPIRVQVMTEDDHMIWLTRSLATWYDEAVEVRDEEHKLLKKNEALFELTNDELRTPEVQRTLQAQAAAERVNGRRLGRLVASGSRLLDEAARNPQFNANTMDDWAEMMSSLKDIADTRMPSVATLLAEASRAEEGKPLPPSAVAGVNRDTPQPGAEQGGAAPELPNDPTVADVESSFNEAGETQGEGEDGSESGGAPASLGLAETVVQGGGPEQDGDQGGDEAGGEQPPSPTRDQLAKAIEEQRALMEEFQKVAGEISEILANLEGSTFVKRLKALSRAETGVAQDLDATLAAAFGADELPASAEDVARRSAKIQEASAERASLIREDLGAYIQRLESTGKDTGKFVTVRTEMGERGVAREMGVLADLAEMSHAGEAIAGAENLADDLDRWAEILVGPG